MRMLTEMNERTPRVDAARQAFIAWKASDDISREVPDGWQLAAILDKELTAQSAALAEANEAIFEAQAELMKAVSTIQKMRKGAADNGLEFVEDEEGCQWARNTRAESAEASLEEARRDQERLRETSMEALSAMRNAAWNAGRFSPVPQYEGQNFSLRDESGCTEVDYEKVCDDLERAAAIDRALSTEQERTHEG